jgi:hypothetical protein
MPHQLAVRSGVIHPKYPAAPRQWVTYMGDQPTGGGAVSQPNLASGVQRNFSRRWSGDAESRFPRLEGLGRAAMLGAIGKLLSESINQPTAPPSGGRPPAPYGMTGPGKGQQPTSAQPPPGGPPAPGGSQRRHYAWGTRYMDDDEPAGAIGGMRGIGAGDDFIDAEVVDTPPAVGGMKGLPAGDDFIDVESWETAGDLGPGKPQSSFVSPALELASRQSPLALTSGRAKRTPRPRNTGKDGMLRIRQELSELTKNLL